MEYPNEEKRVPLYPPMVSPNQNPFVNNEPILPMDFAPSAPSFTYEEILEEKRREELRRFQEKQGEQRRLELSIKEQEQKKREETKKVREEEIRKMMEMQQQAVSKYMIQDEEDDDFLPSPQKEVKKNGVSCPICSKPFDSEKIEVHVNVCLDEPKVVSSPINSPPKAAQPPKSPPPSYQSPESPKKVEAGIKAQEDYYKFLQQKIAQEEEDRRLALKLMENPSPPIQQSPRPSLEDQDSKFALELQKQEEEEFARSKKLKEEQDRKLSDAKFALELQKQEEEEFARIRKLKEEQDRKLAEDLEKKDKEIIEAQKKKKEWDDTVKIIKQEVRTENDEMLAKLLKEKEDLLSQLERAKHQQVMVEERGPASINLDGVEYPDYWLRQVADFQTFEVKFGTEEYYKIANEFSRGLPNNSIKRIERNQNRTQWMWYFLKRQFVASNNKMDPNEMFLFHGSRNDAYDIIIKDGMDHRVANLSGAFGAGIYFAPASSTSSGYVSGSNKGNHRMLYCRVTLGMIGPGSSGLRRPPEIKKGGRLYDSVGNNTMYVIFDNQQCYPEYIIYYR